MKLKTPLTLALLTLLSTLLFWALFYFHLPQSFGFPASGMETLFANYDGPNYLVIAKCGYDSDCIRHNFSLPSPLEYYPAHLPGYPRLVGLLNSFIPGPQAMLLTTLLGSVFLSLAFFYFLKLYIKENSAFWITLIFLIFPARFFVLRQIGAPETWFLASTIASVYFYKKNKIFISALLAAVSLTFKSPGILLFAAYGVAALFELVASHQLFLVIKKYWLYLLVPLTALMIFYGYQVQTGDFWAYFNSGDNFHLNPLPYLVFISNRSWINSIWLEDIIYIYLIAFYGLYRLWQKNKLDIVTIYTGVFVAATVLVAHRDISRYIAPIYPFLLLSFHRFLTRPAFKVVLLLLMPAIVLYAINFVIGNTAPIADWTPYL